MRCLPPSTSLPALATDPVAVAGPVDFVAASGEVVEVDLALAVAPEGVEVAAVSSLADGHVATDKGHFGIGDWLGLRHGHGEGANGRRQGREEGGEGDHGGCSLMKM